MKNISNLDDHTGTSAVDPGALISTNPDAWFEQKFAEQMDKRAAEHTPSMMISKKILGTLGIKE
jgi:hypothetical protein